MNVKDLSLEGVKLIEPRVFSDKRGYFMETYSASKYEGLGIDYAFVQDNLSYSQYGVVRGLHYQLPHKQGKLVQVLQGEVFDVAVDIRQESPTFGRWCGETLSDKNHHQLWVPPGFAHGFCVLSETAIFSYKCTDYYSPSSERAIRWDDPKIGIDWPIKPIEVSRKDANAPLLSQLPEDSCPLYSSLPTS